jgi:hypothetical protein
VFLNKFGASPVGWLRPRSDPERLRPGSAIGCSLPLQSAAATDTMPAAAVDVVFDRCRLGRGRSQRQGNTVFLLTHILRQDR